MPDDLSAVAAATELPIAAVDFTLPQGATVNEVVSAVRQMFDAVRLIAAELLRTGAVTPANPVMQNLIASGATLEQAIVFAQQQAQQQQRVIAPTLHMQPQRRPQ